MTTYDNVTREFIAIRDSRKQQIFNILHQHEDHNLISNKEKWTYSDDASFIFSMVKMYGEGFVADIATRGCEDKEISDKQRWCVVYAFVKISDQQIADYFNSLD